VEEKMMIDGGRENENVDNVGEKRSTRQGIETGPPYENNQVSDQGQTDSKQKMSG
jgi:hypothetical protein